MRFSSWTFAQRHKHTLRSYLSVGVFVIRAGGQQDTPAGVGELAVVYLFVVFYVELSDQNGSLNIPQL